MGTETGNHSDGDGARTEVSAPVAPPVFDRGERSPSESLVAGTMGDRCVSCGAPLASDQRYCVNCGERRGAARFALPASTASAGPSSPGPESRKRSRRPRPSSGATLVAGVGTLLLALGVGVLIGHGAGSATKTVAQPRAQVIKVNEGGGGGVATNSGAVASSGGGGSTKQSKTGGSSKQHKSGGSSSKHKSSQNAKQASAPPPPKPTKQEVQAAQDAANKVTGGGNVNNAPATVTIGGSCSGAGCDPKTHKFNGNFFGQ
jgi:hypothetical protein